MTQLKCHLWLQGSQLSKAEQVPLLSAPTAFVRPPRSTPTLYFICVYVCLLQQTGSPTDACELAWQKGGGHRLWVRLLGFKSRLDMIKHMTLDMLFSTLAFSALNEVKEQLSPTVVVTIQK